MGATITDAKIGFLYEWTKPNADSVTVVRTMPPAADMRQLDVFVRPPGKAKLTEPALRDVVESLAKQIASRLRQNQHNDPIIEQTFLAAYGKWLKEEEHSLGHAMNEAKRRPKAETLDRLQERSSTALKILFENSEPAYIADALTFTDVRKIAVQDARRALASKAFEAQEVRFDLMGVPRGGFGLHQRVDLLTMDPAGINARGVTHRLEAAERALANGAPAFAYDLALEASKSQFWKDIPHPEASALRDRANKLVAKAFAPAIEQRIEVLERSQEKGFSTHVQRDAKALLEATRELTPEQRERLTSLVEQS